jgi:N-acetylneuraminic acid mutarotase
MRLLWAIVLVSSMAVVPAGASNLAASRTLSIEERIAAESAIEQVYWSHRIWPKDNPGPKPPLSEVMPGSAIRAKVEDDLRKSRAVETIWGRSITPAELQAEMNRISAETRDGAMLRELFAALDDDPVLVAECLVRPLLADRIARTLFDADERHGGADRTRFDSWWERTAASFVADPAPIATTGLVLALPAAGCTDDTWQPTKQDAPDARELHAAVWTGSEMLIWGGSGANQGWNDGWRYVPSTNAWARITQAGAPSARSRCAFVWTGTQMIVWGGLSDNGYTNDGGRYNPASDTWMPIAPTGAPPARENPTVVWTGSQMIVWGGDAGGSYFNTGGRYTPATDSWTVTSVTNAPVARNAHTAVWTGSLMIVWGGNPLTNTGGRYNPATNAWTATDLATAPTANSGHVAVWTGTRMILWGGTFVTTAVRYDPATNKFQPISTVNQPILASGHSGVWTGSRMIVWGGAGGVYDPVADAWTPTSMVNAPTLRGFHTAVWTGTEMIVWGGGWPELNTGGRYNPATDSWVATSTGTVPATRVNSTAVWTGTEMVIWGGSSTSGLLLNSGTRYSPSLDTWTPTSLTNAPAGREKHSAVWTGAKMIVWGGTAPGSTATNTGGQYDPAANSWTATSVASAPDARQEHVAVWTGTTMVVWAGFLPGFANLPSTGGRYDPLADTWSSTKIDGAPVGRRSGFAVWSGSRMVVWGGVSPPNGGRYDPVDDSWLPMGTLGQPPWQDRTKAAWSGLEMIIWGNHVGGRYDPLSDLWRSVTTTGAPPVFVAATTWTGSEMLAWSATNGFSASDGMWRYAPSANSWRTGSTLNGPAARDQTNAVWTGSEMIVWGGADLLNGGRYCACPTPETYFRDADGDGFGVASTTATGCVGIAPFGYSATAGDCDDADERIYPGAPEICDGKNDNCSDPSWPAVPANEANPSDYDHDGEVDVCDLNDGLIYVLGTDDKTHIEWQQETGPSAWNVYTGDLATLRTSGTYTQAPGSNPLASRSCGVAGPFVSDPIVPAAGQVEFSLVTGVTGGVEGPLGSNSAGEPRQNANPCP